MYLRIPGACLPDQKHPRQMGAMLLRGSTEHRKRTTPTFQRATCVWGREMGSRVVGKSRAKEGRKRISGPGRRSSCGGS